MSRRPALLLSLIVPVLFASVANAAPAGLRLERADVSAYPLLKLYLTYIDGDGRVVTGKTKDDFKLIFDSNEQGAAADAKAIDLTGEPTYLVLVAQVSGAMTDALDEEKRGVRALAAAAGEVRGSKVALISYASDIKRLAELVKPEEIDGAAGGLVLDAEGSEVHLLDAVRTAIDLLNSKAVPDNARKLIVIFSDGLDVNGGERRAFMELGKKANRSNIVIDTIGYAPFEASKLRNLSELVKQSNGTARECKNAQEVSAQFANVADELRKQYVVLFQSVINGDAKDHTIQVVTEAGGRSVYSNNITKLCEHHEVVLSSQPLWRRRWFWPVVLGVPGGFVLIMAILAIARRRRESGHDHALAPPSHTMALDLGGARGAGPSIGWLVGMSGPHHLQTFKLKTPRTVIGTGAEADIRIDDSFMSTRHCEVRFEGAGFRVFDLGSTNGIVLNEKRVTEGELVDGDAIRLGKTEFRFKSVNC